MSTKQQKVTEMTGIDPDDPQVKRMCKHYNKVQLAQLVTQAARELGADLADQVIQLKRQLERAERATEAGNRNYRHALEREQVWREAHRQLAGASAGKPSATQRRLGCGCDGDHQHG